MSWEATILPSAPRAADWERVFGGRTVRVTSPLPVKADYLLDVAALTPDVRGRLVAHIAARFQLPLLAEDVSVPIPLRYLI